MINMINTSKTLLIIFFAVSISNILISTQLPSCLTIAYIITIIIGTILSAQFIVSTRVVSWFCLSYIALFFISPIYVLSGQQYEDSFGYLSYSSLVNFTFFSINCFYLFLFSYIIFSSNFSQYEQLRKNSQIKIQASSSKVILVFLCISFLIMSLVFFDYGTASFTGLSKEAMRNNKSIATLLSLYLIYASIPLYFILGAISRNKASFLIYSILILFSLYIFFIFKIRTFILAHIISFSIGYLVGYKEKHKNIIKAHKKNKISFWKFAFITPPILFLAVFIRFFRGYFDQLGFFGALDAVDINVFLEKSLLYGDFGYSPFVMRLMNLFPDTYDYLYGSSYWRLLFIFIPRFIYPEKPFDTQNFIGSIFFPLTPGMTVPPGVNGDAYINFGFWGILVFIIHGLLFAFIDKREKTLRLMLFASSFSIVFHYTRGAFTNPILIFIVVYFSCKFYQKSFRIKIDTPNTLNKK